MDPIGGLKLVLLCYGMVENGAEWNADAGASRVDHSGRGYHKGYELSESNICYDRQVQWIRQDYPRYEANPLQAVQW